MLTLIPILTCTFILYPTEMVEKDLIIADFIALTIMLKSWFKILMQMEDFAKQNYQALILLIWLYITLYFAPESEYHENYEIIMAAIFVVGLVAVLNYE